MANEIEIVVKGRRDPSTKSAFDGVKREAREASRDIGETFAGLKGKLAVAGVAAGVALLAGVGEALEGGQQAAKTAAQLGMDDPDQVAMFGRTAGKLYSSAFADSVAEGQQAIRAVVGAGILAEDATEADIQAISERALTLSKVFDQDLGRSVSAVQQLIRTGLAKDSEQAFDLITRGIQQGLDKSGDLNDTIIEYSTQFRELGISGPKAFGLISQAMRAGARDSDTVADAIKEFAIRSKDGSATSKAAFEAIGLDSKEMFQTFARGGPNADKAMKTVIDRLKGMKDPVAQDAAAVGLFGTKAEDLQDALYALDPTTAVDAMGNIEGATERAGDAMADAAKNDLTVLWREMKQKLVDFLQQQVIPRVRDLAHWIRDEVVPAIAGMVRWVRENKDVLIPLATAILTVVAAIKTASLVSDIWRNSFDLLNKVMGMNPLVRLIGLITGVVTWFITAYQTSEDFRNRVNAAMAKVRDFFVGVWNKIVEIWNGVKKFFTETIPGWIKSAWNFIYDAVVGPYKAAYRDIKELAWDAIGGAVIGGTRPGSPGAIIKEQMARQNAEPTSVNYGSKPRVPGSAHGGIASGWRAIHERGGELLKLPSGTHVYPAEATARMTGAGGGNVTVVVTAGMQAGADSALLDAVLRLLRFDIRTRGGGDVVGYLAGAA